MQNHFEIYSVIRRAELRKCHIQIKTLSEHSVPSCYTLWACIWCTALSISLQVLKFSSEASLLRTDQRCDIYAVILTQYKWFLQPFYYTCSPPWSRNAVGAALATIPELYPSCTPSSMYLQLHGEVKMVQMLIWLERQELAATAQKSHGNSEVC